MTSLFLQFVGGIQRRIQGLQGFLSTLQRCLERVLMIYFSFSRSGFQLIPAVFSHTGQIHTVFKDFIREQIRQKFVDFENQAKPSKINSVFKWWSKCISMVIAKTASRNVIYKANKLGESMFVRQSEMLIPEEELGSQSPVSYEEDFEDLSSNVDLYVFNDQMVQGYRGVNINSRHNEESLGEMYRKDDIDVSNQEHTAPVYFQSLSLD